MKKEQRKGKERLIGYTPFGDGDNPYTANMKRILGRFGRVVAPPTLRQLANPKGWRRFDLMVFNWIENEFVSIEGRVKVYPIARQIIWILACRLFATKTVFVRHNIVPHATAVKNARLVQRIVDAFEKIFDVVWVHSGHYAVNGRRYVPHPLYRRLDAGHWPVNLRRPEGPYYVMFGRILPYKNIDSLLAVLSPDVRLVICGAGPDREYLIKLRSLAGERVVLHADFLSEADAQCVVAGSCGLVVCSNETDMIVSGSVIFGLSMGVPVLTVNSPFSRWLIDRYPGGGVHDYSSIENLSLAMRDGKAHERPVFNAVLVNAFSDDEVAKAMSSSLADR